MSGRPQATPPTGMPFKSLTADGIVKTGPGTLHMVKIASSSGGSIKIYDNTAASGTVILETMAVAAGEEHYLPAEFSTGCYVDITGTVALTVFFV